MRKKLEIGYRHSGFEVRNYNYIIDKQVEIKILYLSDLHLTRYSKNLTEKIISLFHKELPDIILFGGDYIDEKRGSSYLYQLFASAKKISNTFAILGNHDRYWNASKLKEVIKETGIRMLDKEGQVLKVKDIKIQFNIPALINSDDDGACIRIGCFHKPKAIEEYKGKYEIVFSGHLHGCQIILWEDENSYYPGKYFYKWNIGKYQDDNLLYLVSKGLGDTLPIRYNCSKDILKVIISGNNSGISKY